MAKVKMPCGQMNKNGELCKNLGLHMDVVGLPGMVRPCKKHMTEEWNRLWGYAMLAWNHGKMTGLQVAREEQGRISDAAQERLKTNVKVLEHKVERLTSERDSAREMAAQRSGSSAGVRKETVMGFQIVEVSGYAYEWTGKEKLRVGDRVKLPGNWVSPSGWEGVVGRLGSDYTGKMARVVRKLG